MNPTMCFPSVYLSKYLTMPPTFCYTIDTGKIIRDIVWAIKFDKGFLEATGITSKTESNEDRASSPMKKKQKETLSQS